MLHTRALICGNVFQLFFSFFVFLQVFGSQQKMGRSSFLLIVCLSSLGSLIQTLHSLDSSDSVRLAQGIGRNNNAPDSLYSELIFHSVSSSDSVEGSGQSVDSKASRRAGSEKRSGSTTPALTLHDSGAQGQGADRANTSITGDTQSSVHIISEEALGHVTSEEQFKESHAFTVNDDFLDGK